MKSILKNEEAKRLETNRKKMTGNETPTVKTNTFTATLAGGGTITIAMERQTMPAV